MHIFTQLISLCWIVFMLYWVASWFGVKRDRMRYGWWRSWRLRVALIVLLLLALRIPYVRMIAVRVRVAGVAPWSAPLAVFGVLLCVFGIGYAIWARWHLGKNWSPAPALKEKHELVTSGPYRYVRHPIYTGTLIAALGSGIADPYWFFMFALMLVMFVRRVFVEERLMMQEFPEQYPQYKKHTWALIPWVW